MHHDRQFLTFIRSRHAVDTPMVGVDWTSVDFIAGTFSMNTWLINCIPYSQIFQILFSAAWSLKLNGSKLPNSSGHFQILFTKKSLKNASPDVVPPLNSGMQLRSPFFFAFYKFYPMLCFSLFRQQSQNRHIHYASHGTESGHGELGIYHFYHFFHPIFNTSLFLQILSYMSVTLDLWVSFLLSLARRLVIHCIRSLRVGFEKPSESLDKTHVGSKYPRALLWNEWIFFRSRSKCCLIFLRIRLEFEPKTFRLTFWAPYFLSAYRQTCSNVHSQMPKSHPYSYATYVPPGGLLLWPCAPDFGAS